jgi:murein DD-endopeptidase MepM/ murein hydrolase activator NlpD
MRDFIARTELVRRVIRSNQSLAESLLSTKTDLEAARLTLERVLETMQVRRTEAEEAERELRQLRAKRQSSVDAQEAIYRQKSALFAETAANAKRLKQIAEEEERESARIAAELARASQGSGYFAGIMAWPVPGFYTITSPYGYRIHPILGVRKLHTGIDIGKNGSTPINGQPIVSAGAGTVIYAGWRSGYGNTVMIDHGNGVVTLYAHQQNGGIHVSVGEHVAKGARIGTVGSTGYSTGPHLHFEVRVNGTPKDPMPYLR